MSYPIKRIISLIRLSALCIFLCLPALGYGALAPESCFNFNTKKLAAFDYKQLQEKQNKTGYTSVLSKELILGQRIIIDHDHAAVGIGNVVRLNRGVLVPFIAIGEAFFPAGITWESGLAYCYENYGIRVGYEGVYNIPSYDGDENFPVVHRGFLLQDLFYSPVLVTILLKYGGTWEHYRAETTAPYYKTRFRGIETGLLLNTPLLRHPLAEIGLFTYSTAAYLERTSTWTLNSLLSIDMTLFPVDLGELKWISTVIHTYSSTPEIVLASRSMFFISPYIAKTDTVFYEQKTAGFLAGSFNIGYRFFPFYVFKEKVSWAGKVYIAPYIHYGWGLKKDVPAAKSEHSVSFSVHVGFKFARNAAVSTSIGWNIDEGIVITVIANF